MLHSVVFLFVLEAEVGMIADVLAANWLTHRTFILRKPFIVGGHRGLFPSTINLHNAMSVAVLRVETSVSPRQLMLCYLALVIESRL